MKMVSQRPSNTPVEHQREKGRVLVLPPVCDQSRRCTRVKYGSTAVPQKPSSTLVENQREKERVLALLPVCDQPSPAKAQCGTSSKPHPWTSCSCGRVALPIPPPHDLFSVFLDPPSMDPNIGACRLLLAQSSPLPSAVTDRPFLKGISP
jgi:hypothetical protein